MTFRFAWVSTAFMAALFVPHMLLGIAGIYFPKLRVTVEFNAEFYVGLSFAGLFCLSFIGVAALSGICRATLKKHILSIEKRKSFRFLMVALTGIMFVLLAAGIGAKQSDSGLNFVIRLFPREMVLVFVSLAAAATFQFFWIGLLLANVAYWVLVGSKASIFLLVLSLVMYHTLERHKITFRQVLWALIAAVLLPFSFVIPAALRLGVSPAQLLGSLRDSPELIGLFMGRILGRVSWFDGMFLIKDDVTGVSHYGVSDFLMVALARIIPGVRPPEAPFGQNVIYLFKAADLEDFSGAIGIPGMLKVMTFNHGLWGFAGSLGIILASLFLFMRMAKSRSPEISLVGFMAFVIALLSLVISGNIDSSIGKIIPLLISGLLFLSFTRQIFRKPNYLAETDT